MIEVENTTDRVEGFVKEYYMENLKFPTFQVIANGVGLSSKSTVFAHMYKLEKQGRIEFIDNQYRLNKPHMVDLFKAIIMKWEESEGE